MLTHLFIENFAIIEKAELEFHAGMTIITGETGAGKSILLDALQLVLGARAESHFIRKDSQKCEITAIFDMTHYANIQIWLKEKNIDIDNHECFVRRSINQEGRSRCFINNQAVPLQILKTLGLLLINLHGQHEHQALLNRDTHRECLDAYGQHEDLLNSINILYKEYNKIYTQLKQYQQKFENRETRLAFLQYQIDEFSALNITSENLLQLEAEHKALSQIKNNIDIYYSLLNILDENLLPNLYKAQHLSNSFKNIPELLETAKIQLEEASGEIKNITENTNLNPAYLADLENKLSKIYDMARKHRVKPENLADLFSDLEKELKTLQSMDHDLINLEKNLDKIKSEYLILSQKLSESRHKAAQLLSKEITAILQTLNMKGVKFSISLIPYEENQLTPYGAEKIEFLVSANPGQPLQSIAKVASGGELSRISLAIDLIAAKNQCLPTLIFDEVDVGIGGATAAKVGQLLKQLSQKAQVICITHQPQVAAFGTYHLHVEKIIKHNKTSSYISYLTSEQKIQEIARMLGGLEITEQALSHARELVGSEV